MKFFKLGLIITALALFAFACGQNAANTNTASVNKNAAPANTNAAPGNTNAAAAAPANDELASSKKIFSEKCVKCHKDNGEGGEVDIDGKKIRVPNFKAEKIAAKDDKAYTRYIVEGDDDMPSFKDQLKPEEIAGLIKLIRKDFQGK
jgi:mono/diheme cytochrome c family protein